MASNPSPAESQQPESSPVPGSPTGPAVPPPGLDLAQADRDAWFRAVDEGRTEYLAEHLDSGLAGCTDSEGKTALMRAAAAGNEEAVKLLFNKERTAVTPEGWTALMSAACSGHKSIVERLAPIQAGERLKKGVDGFPAGATALSIAALCGHADCVEVLYKNGEETGEDGRDFPPVVYYSAIGAADALAKALREIAEREGEDIPGAPEEGTEAADPAAVIDLFPPDSQAYEKVAAIRDSLGNTPLVYAALCRNEEGTTNFTSVFTILGHFFGSRVDELGRTPLMLAAQSGNLWAVKALVDIIPEMVGKRCIKVEPGVDTAGLDALLSCSNSLNFSVYGDHRDVADFLSDKEEKKARDALTPLMIAAARGHVELCKRFADQVGFVTEDPVGNILAAGSTALMLAAQYGQLECAKVLADDEAGASNCNGKVALQIAEDKHHDDVASFLRSYQSESAPSLEGKVGSKARSEWENHDLATDKDSFTQSLIALCELLGVNNASDLAKRCKELVESDEANKEEITRLKEELKSVSKERDDLKTDKETLEQQLDEECKENAKLSESYKAIKDTPEKLSTAQKKIAALEQRIKDLEKMNSEQTCAKENEYKDSIAQLKEQLEEQKTATQKANESLQQSQQECDKLKEEVERLSEALEDAQKKIAEHEKRDKEGKSKQQLEEENAGLEEQKKKLESEIASLNERLEVALSLVRKLSDAASSATTTLQQSLELVKNHRELDEKPSERLGK